MGEIIVLGVQINGTRGGAVGWGTALSNFHIICLESLKQWNIKTVLVIINYIVVTIIEHFLRWPYIHHQDCMNMFM
jgi:hypothetical protein